MHLTGELTRNREVGYCFRADGLSLNQAIIANGAALACPRYDARYLHLETDGGPRAATSSECCKPR